MKPSAGLFLIVLITALAGGVIGARWGAPDRSEPDASAKVLTELTEKIIKTSQRLDRLENLINDQSRNAALQTRQNMIADEASPSSRLVAPGDLLEKDQVDAELDQIRSDLAYLSRKIEYHDRIIMDYEQVKMATDELIAEKRERDGRGEKLRQVSDDYLFLMEQDENYYGNRLAEARELYAMLPQDPESAWNSLVDQFPDSNLTGCAALKMAEKYLSENNQAQAETFLKKSVDDYFDATYPNGLKVGPLAAFNLGRLYIETGKTEEGISILEKLRQDFPGALAGDGSPMGEKISKMLNEYKSE